MALGMATHIGLGHKFPGTKDTLFRDFRRHQDDLYLLHSLRQGFMQSRLASKLLCKVRVALNF